MKTIVESRINVIATVIFLIVLFIVIFSFIWKATGPETWYAGAHDAKHEGDGCKCYERFLEKSD